MAQIIINWGIDGSQFVVNEGENTQEIKSANAALVNLDKEQAVTLARSIMNSVAAEQSKTIAQPTPFANDEPTQDINVPIPLSLHKQLKVYCAQKGLKMKELVPLAIKEYVERQA